MYTGRQAGVGGVQLGRGRLGDFPAVGAEQHEGGTDHDLMAILGGRAGAKLLAFADAGDVAHPDGHAVTAVQHDVADRL